MKALMEVISNPIVPDVKTIIPQVFDGLRGWLVEQYEAAGITADFVQDNESFSSKGVVRGFIGRRCLAIRSGGI